MISSVLNLLPTSLKTTSRLYIIFLHAASHNLYRFIPSLYPMKIHLTTFVSNLLLFPLGTCTNASQPNTLRCETKGLLPDHTSFGFFSTSTEEGDIFNRYFAVLTTSAHNSYVSSTPLRIFLALSINVLFIFLETPFFCGVYGLVFWHAMPHFL
jgi:hypothetical protein